MNIEINLYNIIFFILLVAAVFFALKISFADWRRRIIPDVYLLPLSLAGLIIVIFFPWPVSPAEAVITATSGYLMASVVGWLFEQLGNKKTAVSPIGLGDIKLITTGGIWLGSLGLSMALILACISGIIWGRHQKQKFIPFAPFFITSGILSLIIITFLI